MHSATSAIVSLCALLVFGTTIDEGDQTKQSNKRNADSSAETRRNETEPANPRQVSTEKDAKEQQVTASSDNAGQSHEDDQAQTTRIVEQFVKSHQPKLADLLAFLKRRDQFLFQTAIRDLSKSIHRLEILEPRDPELYAIELEIWKIRSQLRLIAARLSVVTKNNAEPERRSLQTLIKREHLQELKRLTLLRDRAAAEVSKFDARIKELDSSESEILAKALKSWDNRINKQKNRNAKNTEQ